MKMISEIKGTQFGVVFVARGPDDPHIAIQIISEDDGNWFKHGGSFSSHWIDDLINQLQQAKILLEAGAVKDRSGYGYEFTTTTK